jgi:hypothetical protein
VIPPILELCHPLQVLNCAKKVTLGITGIVPDPPTTTAQIGDIVNFIFGAGLVTSSLLVLGKLNQGSNSVHSVTQTSFESPCVPLPGGFNSGLVSVSDAAGANRTWALRITDASQRSYMSEFYTGKLIYSFKFGIQRSGFTAKPFGQHRIVLMVWLGELANKLWYSETN